MRAALRGEWVQKIAVFCGSNCKKITQHEKTVHVQKERQKRKRKKRPVWLMAVLPRFDSVMSKVTHAAHVKASCFDVSHSLSLCLLYNKLVIFSHDVLMMTPSHSLMCPSRLFRHTAHIGHAPVGSVWSIQSGCIPAQLQLSDKVNVSATFPKAVGVPHVPDTEN